MGTGDKLRPQDMPPGSDHRNPSLALGNVCARKFSLEPVRELLIGVRKCCFVGEILDPVGEIGDKAGLDLIVHNA